MMKILKSLIVIFFAILIFVPISYAVGLGRWQFPTKIKTYIPPDHKRTVMMRHAFSRWSKVTNNKIVFVYVPNRKTAQIEVEFVKVIPNADRQIGLTQARKSGNSILHAKVLIAEKTVNMQSLSDDAVFTVMLHEIGHAIGLDHSNNKMSIMYPSEDDRQEILKSDLKTLAEIYGWK